MSYTREKWHTSEREGDNLFFVLYLPLFPKAANFLV